MAGFIWFSHNNVSLASVGKSNLSNLGQDNQVAAPLDALSSADIAANIAEVTSMPEAIAVSNQADSVNAQVASAVTDQAIVTKPQVVSGGTKSNKDIQKYVTKDGDNVASVAAQFGITSESIKWSNNLTTDSLPAGRELLVPPRNGIVYKVAPGDTVESLSSKYSADKDLVVAYNDAETAGLPVGQNIVIPDGKMPAPISTSTTTTRNTANTSTGVTSSSAAYSFTPQYGGNGYAPGWCTWYVASRVNIPRNWGNANTWAMNAAASGWIVSSKPVAGAIAQTGGGWGHVAYVESVSPDGSQIIYSDMNGLAGFGRVGVSGWVPVSHFPHYIYR